eukprot:Clim_evm23s26 gene=Clim_evmTU23s26
MGQQPVFDPQWLGDTSRPLPFIVALAVGWLILMAIDYEAFKEFLGGVFGVPSDLANIVHTVTTHIAVAGLQIMHVLLNEGFGAMVNALSHVYTTIYMLLSSPLRFIWSAATVWIVYSLYFRSDIKGAKASSGNLLDPITQERQALQRISTVPKISGGDVSKVVQGYATSIQTASQRVLQNVLDNPRDIYSAVFWTTLTYMALTTQVYVVDSLAKYITPLITVQLLVFLYLNQQFVRVKLGYLHDNIYNVLLGRSLPRKSAATRSSGNGSDPDLRRSRSSSPVKRASGVKVE